MIMLSKNVTETVRNNVTWKAIKNTLLKLLRRPYLNNFSERFKIHAA